MTMIFILGGFRKGVVITFNNHVSQLTNYSESECAYYGGKIEWAWHLIQCYRPKSGRYLRAQLLYADTSIETTLAVYELMVYGY